MTTQPFERIAIVTGASSGIGEAVARAFVASRFAVIGNARNPDRLAALERELGDGFSGVAADASDPATPALLFAEAERQFGKPADLVVANAGRGLGGSIKDADSTRFQELIAINVSGTLSLLREAARRLTADGANDLSTPRDIVAIGSVVGRHISPFSAVYGATKFAVHAMAESLRRDLGPQGVRVSLVEPGFVLSGFQAAAGYSDSMVQGFQDRCGPLLKGEEVADAILYMVTRAPHVHVGDLVIRPVRQDYP